MKPIVGVADSLDTVAAHLGAIALFHGIALSADAYAFAAVPRDGAHETFATLDADPNITLLPDPIDAAITDAGLLKKLAKIGGKQIAKGATARDARAALHALGATHLFDPRLG